MTWPFYTPFTHPSIQWSALHLICLSLKKKFMVYSRGIRTSQEALESLLKYQHHYTSLHGLHCLNYFCSFSISFNGSSDNPGASLSYNVEAMVKIVPPPPKKIMSKFKIVKKFMAMGILSASVERFNVFCLLDFFKR